MKGEQAAEVFAAAHSDLVLLQRAPVQPRVARAEPPVLHHRPGTPVHLSVANLTSKLYGRIYPGREPIRAGTGGYTQGREPIGAGTGGYTWGRESIGAGTGGYTIFEERNQHEKVGS
eukprot:1184744-Prorocentrum_minimum.AAC.1